MSVSPVLLLLAASTLSTTLSTTSPCRLPPELETVCQCDSASLECRDLNTTLPLSLLSVLSPGTARTITSLTIVESGLACLELLHLTGLSALTEISVRHSGLTAPLCPPARPVQPGLEVLTSLDFSHNQLGRLELTFPSLPSLTSLNLSHNHITTLHPVFKELTGLKVLDLSDNSLSQLERRVLEELPRSLSQLDISGNPWPCLPSLSWLYTWAARRNISSSSSSCAIPLSPTGQQAPLLTVMQHYDSQVSPHCHPGCRCHFYHFKLLSRSFVAGTNISYTVIVNCTNSSLTTFPSLPPQTTVLDLSHNKLSQESLEMLDVGRQNYLDLNSLILSHNNIRSIGTKLLKLKLHRSFKADHNSLTDIPYDFSQVLQKYDTMLISLANNPWQCSCTAQITDTVRLSV